MALLIGIETTTLTDADCNRLTHPSVSGIILFTRNYQNLTQLTELVKAIRKLAPHLVISVDHEGGRVQRFREEFTLLPAAATFGKIFDSRPQLAITLTEKVGIILAYELRRVDIDFSFAPVLDLQDTQSSVIGDRAFHANPAVVSVLSCAMRRGMHRIGMAAVGKHYPGHGRVTGDSHHCLPSDLRHYHEREADRYPFVENIKDGIEAIMSAHIMLPENTLPAGFSAHTLHALREMGFEGAIISDDLDMAGAKIFADPVARVQAALNAGADAAMICNTFTDMDTVLAQPLTRPNESHSYVRIQALRAKPLTQAMRSDYHAALTFFQEHISDYQ